MAEISRFYKELEENRKKAIVRLDIVQLWWTRKLDLHLFVKLYNAGDLSRQLLEESGPITETDLTNWEENCIGVVIEKNTASDAAFIESLKRYIEALEGKAKMQEENIRYLQEKVETLLASVEKLEAEK